MPIMVDLSGRRPRLRIYAEADKGGQDRLLPMTPDFAEFLLKTPRVDRQGLVFPIMGLTTRQPITPKRVSRIVSAIKPITMATATVDATILSRPEKAS
ncbi:MAG: hypothetical protein K8T25_13925 [Planctomycetia bacterium]|nr:hypothetical protein [Planctomycetia bacterium]